MADTTFDDGPEVDLAGDSEDFALLVLVLSGLDLTLLQLESLDLDILKGTTLAMAFFPCTLHFLDATSLLPSFAEDDFATVDSQFWLVLLALFFRSQFCFLLLDRLFLPPARWLLARLRLALLCLEQLRLLPVRRPSLVLACCFPVSRRLLPHFLQRFTERDPERRLSPRLELSFAQDLPDLLFSLVFFLLLPAIVMI